MKKRRFVISVLLLAMMMTLILPVELPVYADQVEGDFTYTTDGTGATITVYNGAGGDVEIPETLGGYPVTVIGDNAFFNKNLTSIIIPDSVKTIGEFAFALNLLSTITIPDNVITIGYAAFAANLISSITIPDNVTTVGDASFTENHNLLEVTIGASVTLIGKEAFENCTSLGTVNFKGTNAPTFGEDSFDYIAAGAQANVPANNNYDDGSYPFMDDQPLKINGLVDHNFDISEGNITVKPGTDPDTIKVTYGNPQTTTAEFANTERILITGTTTANKVVVTGVEANIKLSSADIQPNGVNDTAFSIVNGANVALALTGDNILKSTGGNAGLRVTNGQAITIKGAGSLTATGGVGGAGIGGSNGYAGGSITIMSPATVMAVSSGTVRPAIQTADGSLESASTAKVMMVNLAAKQTANTNTDIYLTSPTLLYKSFTPSIAYKSIAFTVPDNDTYLLMTADKLLLQGGDTDFTITDSGLTTFDSVTQEARVISHSGIFAGKYGKAQIFDVQRNPPYPTGGNAFELSRFRNIFDSITGEIIDWGNNNDRYVQFADSAMQGSSNTYPDAYLVKLNLYEADDTFVKTIADYGTVWGIEVDGFFYEGHDYYGYFITNAQGYSYGSSLTYTPTSGLVADIEDLNNYGATTTVLEEGDTATEANLTTLNAVKDEVDALLSADYTPGSWETVTDAVYMPEGTDGEILAKLIEINDAIAGLITVAAEEDLIAAKDGADELLSTDYTAESWEVVTDALALPEGTDAEVIAKTTEINDAISRLITLEEEAANADLAAAKDEAAALTSTDYTAESWEDLTDALALPEDTNAEVIAKTTEINDAIAGLITVSEEAGSAPDTELVAAAKALIEGETYTMAQSAVGAEADVKTEIEAVIAGLDLDGVTAEVTKILYTPAIAGNAGDPDGTNGAYTFTVELSKGAASDTTAILTMTITATAYTAHSRGDDGDSRAPKNQPINQPVIVAEPGANILVNGNNVNAGTAVNTTVEGKTVTTVIVDEKKLEQKLAVAGSNAVVTIPVNTDSDIIVGELNGQMVKSMEDKQATIEVKTLSATYTLPAQQINIDAVSEQIGKSIKLKDIKVQIEIAKPVQEIVKIVENSAKAGEFTIIAPPLEFNVHCTYGGKTINVNQFNTYVERTIAIPNGADPTKITTGVIIDPDGTVRHVPTKITIIDGKYYAKINSVTNSIYSLIWHPIAFKDVEQHWAKDTVNDMGSRMVISGVGNDMFEPNRGITRAEFAAIVVRSLGLKPGTGDNAFTDIGSNEWYCKYTETAYEYGIISGYGNGKFGPKDKITREQAMVMITNAMKITGLKLEFKADEAQKIFAEFGDSEQSSAWAKESVATCVKAGIVSGKSGHALAPKDEITRAEAAAMVHRLLKKSHLI